MEQQRAELAGQRARQSSLQEILSDHAYSTETVQRLFEANQGRESLAGFEAVGVLADFLEVEPAYERVVEEFLREELEYVVVKETS